MHSASVHCFFRRKLLVFSVAFLPTRQRKVFIFSSRLLLLPPPPLCRQQRGGVYLRHHGGGCSTRCHHGLQPGQPQPVRLRPWEAGLPRLPGGRVEVGWLLGRRQVRRGVLAALRGRPGDQEKRPAPHEPAQQRGRAKGDEIFHRVRVFQNALSILYTPPVNQWF